MKTYSEVIQTLRVNGVGQHIDLGDEIRMRRDGRIGRTTQVLRDRLFVRFDGAERTSYVYREEVDSVKYLQAQAECIEDDANAAAFRASK